MSQPVSEHVRRMVEDRLRKRRIVVWYDAEGAFAHLAGGMAGPACAVVSAAPSTLRARREAEAVYRRMNEDDDPDAARRALLIYAPRGRGVTPAERMIDPFEVFAIAGAAFGDTEAERLQSLARQALPAHAAEIDRLFREGRPTLDLLDRLARPGAGDWALLRESLGTDAPAEVIALVLCDEARAARISETQGARAELARVMATAIAFPDGPAGEPWPAMRTRLAHFVLFGELACDLPEPMPQALAGVARPPASAAETVFAACDRMRDSADLRDAYVALAHRVETDLRLADLFTADVQTGVRDTFPFEERHALSQLRTLALAGNRTGARTLLEACRRSVFRAQADRAVLWAAAERCLDFLDTAAVVADTWHGQAGSGVRAMVDAYTRPDGWAELDRRQRLFEQGIATCSDDEGEVRALAEYCRARYRAVALAIQERFLARVRDEGWPPEGMPRQTQVFDQHVAPRLAAGGRVAVFLGDGLRYEMGIDLAASLTTLGSVETRYAVSVLPSTTPCGMAALLPGADGALRLVTQGGDTVPALAGRVLKDLDDRMQLLRERYGDRFKYLKLEDLVDATAARVQKLTEGVDLLVVVTQDPDQIAENLGNLRARRYLTETLGDIARAAARLARAGFGLLVVTADHGHILLNEIPPGDVVTPPPGEWTKEKRRSLLGEARSHPPGVVILDAVRAGIAGDPKEICVPAGFKVFKAGAWYFHEGISLQENIVPVVLAEVRGVPAGQPKRTIAIGYARERVTSRVVGLRLRADGDLFGGDARVRVEAYDQAGSRGKRVGEAADCDARDPTTHEVVLSPGVEVQVPVLLDAEFTGDVVDIRVTDPRTGVTWANKELPCDLLL